MNKQQRIAKICKDLGIDIFTLEHMDALVKVCDAYAQQEVEEAEARLRRRGSDILW